jgi:hypothetical protein
MENIKKTQNKNIKKNNLNMRGFCLGVSSLKSKPTSLTEDVKF